MLTWTLFYQCMSTVVYGRRSHAIDEGSATDRKWRLGIDRQTSSPEAGEDNLVTETGLRRQRTRWQRTAEETPVRLARLPDGLLRHLADEMCERQGLTGLNPRVRLPSSTGARQRGRIEMPPPLQAEPPAPPNGAGLSRVRTTQEEWLNTRCRHKAKDPTAKPAVLKGRSPV